MDLDESSGSLGLLGAPLELRSGIRLRNRLVKAAMSDSLGNGAGQPSDAQIQLYRRWCDGGAALSIIGEVQTDPRYPEKPGNLVLDGSQDDSALGRLAEVANRSNAHIWPQLGHAGALAFPPVSAPMGPSALDLDGLRCGEMPVEEIESLPMRFASAALTARDAGFTGVELHAAHGFLLGQFLSPLFNHRADRYGGSIEARGQVLIDVVNRVRRETGPDFAVGVKINATDELEGGLTEPDALIVIEMLDRCGVDVIDISGGTYFPGAPSSSDRPSEGPYYADFAERARQVTTAALMLTGGVKTRSHAIALREQGVDLVGLARTLVLNPDLPNDWLGPGGDPTFPVFTSSPPGGVTAWYTMRLTAIAHGQQSTYHLTPESALDQTDSRDRSRVPAWNNRFKTAR
ncbi:MAG: oxidoreductase [Acidimicrobiales bacterium]